MADQITVFNAEPQDIYQPIFPEKQLPVVPRNIEEVGTQSAIVTASHTGVPLPNQIPKSVNDIETLGMDEVRRQISDQEKSVALKIAEGNVRKSPTVDAAQYYKE